MLVRAFNLVPRTAGARNSASTVAMIALVHENLMICATEVLDDSEAFCQLHRKVRSENGEQAAVMLDYQTSTYPDDFLDPPDQLFIWQRSHDINVRITIERGARELALCRCRISGLLPAQQVTIANGCSNPDGRPRLLTMLGDQNR